jgi:hypothetical protein
MSHNAMRDYTSLNTILMNFTFSRCLSGLAWMYTHRVPGWVNPMNK